MKRKIIGMVAGFLVTILLTTNVPGGASDVLSPAMLNNAGFLLLLQHIENRVHKAWNDAGIGEEKPEWKRISQYYDEGLKAQSEGKSEQAKQAFNTTLKEVEKIDAHQPTALIDQLQAAFYRLSIYKQLEDKDKSDHWERIHRTHQAELTNQRDQVQQKVLRNLGISPKAYDQLLKREKDRIKK